MNHKVLVAKGITKIYGLDTKCPVEALKDVSIEMDEGEFICVMGPSGSGKSTFIHNLSTIDTPTKGQVFINGLEIRSMGSAQIAQFRYQNLGFIFQEFNLLDQLTFYENISVPPILSGVALSDIQKEITLIAKKLEIEDLLSKYPAECSGGQKQRATIARALVNHPKLIIADEPTGNLDSQTAHELLKLFKQLNEEGVSILMVTHDTMTASYSSRLLYIKDGTIQASIEKGELSQKDYFYKIVDLNSKKLYQMIS